MSWISEVRAQFPQLNREARGQKLIYLDSGATTLKPRSVIDAVQKSMSLQTANVHRGAHILSDEATDMFEGVREKVRAFLNAKSKNEIVFTKGTTEGINLLASTLAKTQLKQDDEILLSQMEHHSNIVPWQILVESYGVKVRFAPVNEDGTLDFEEFKDMLNPRTKIVSLVHLSNALGTINPLEKFFAAAKEVGAITIADAAQSISVMPIDVQRLGADFLVFSGHKLFAPTGVGVLYGREELLNSLPPYQGGGSMIDAVTESGVTFLKAPHRFEAGTPAIAEVIGLGAAVDFVKSLGFDQIQAHEKQMMKLTEESLDGFDPIERYGLAPNRSHVYSFIIDSHHPSDVGAILDEQGIAVRAGHHCCQPLMKRFGIPGTVRASFSVYTDESDILAFVNGVKKAMELLG